MTGFSYAGSNEKVSPDRSALKAKRATIDYTSLGDRNVGADITTAASGIRDGFRSGKTSPLNGFKTKDFNNQLKLDLGALKDTSVTPTSGQAPMAVRGFNAFNYKTDGHVTPNNGRDKAGTSLSNPMKDRFFGNAGKASYTITQNDFFKDTIKRGSVTPLAGSNSGREGAKTGHQVVRKGAKSVTRNRIPVGDIVKFGNRIKFNEQ